MIRTMTKLSKRQDWRWRCLECGKVFRNPTAARRAMFSDEGCPKCGGTDFDIARPQDVSR